MANGVEIAYGDIAPDAKENFDVEVSENQFDTIGNLQKYNMHLYNYANPCELYQALLDGTAKALPSNPKTANIGLWSKQLSNDDGTFTEPIEITLTSNGQYSSQGFGLTFDKFNNIYATNLNIKWYRITDSGQELLFDIDFVPTSSFYFCQKQVDNFNKVIITFYSLNMPQNRLKVEAIDFGYGTVFYGDELRNVKLSQSIDPISSEIRIGTCDFTLDSHTNIVYSFQLRQPVTVSFNGNLLSTYFVKSSKRKAKFLWEVNCEDYIGIMDSIAYTGGIYTNKNAGELLEDIFTVAKVPCSIAAEFYDVVLSGYIEYTTCREALMQVCFACMAVATTSGSNSVDVRSLDNDIKQTIPRSRIKQGQSFDNNSTVTSVELVAHTYSPSTEVTEVYKADDSGTGANIFVKFSEPLHDLTITNGEILQSGTNYAVINAAIGCVLSGQKYVHTKLIKQCKNPLILASESDNVISITTATLVNPNNVDKIVEKCYNWLIKTDTTNVNIIVGKDVSKEYIDGEVIRHVTNQKDVNVGDIIECETEYLGNVTGRIVSQSFNLNSNIVVKECELK